MKTFPEPGRTILYRGENCFINVYEGKEGKVYYGPPWPSKEEAILYVGEDSIKYLKYRIHVIPRIKEV